MNIPTGWNELSLRQLSQINYGKSPAAILSQDGSYPVFGTAGPERLGNHYLYDGDSIVLGRKGTIDRVHYASGKFWTIDTAYYLSHFRDAIPRWLFYFLQTVNLAHLNEATGVPSLSREALYRIRVSTPPSDEQVKIADVLSNIDRAIEQTQELLVKQQRVQKGLMHDLLTKGIDEHGVVRSETSRFTDSLVGRIPQVWTPKRLGNALRDIGGFLQTGPFGSQLHAHEYVAEGVPVVMPQDIISGGISTRHIARVPEIRARDLARHRLQPNDIAFSRRGDLTKAAAISEREEGWLCGTGCFLLRAPVDGLDARWLSEVYRHDRTQRQVETNAVGSTMPSLNNAVMANLMIAFPPLDEQREIVKRLDAARADIAANSTTLAKLQSIKTGVMQDLLSGQVRVTPLLEESVEPALEQVS